MMIRLKSLVKMIVDWFHYIFFFIKALLMDAEEKAFIMAQFRELNEDIKFGKKKKRRAGTSFRQLSILLSIILPNSINLNILAKPQTIVKWRNNLFKFIWAKKSKRSGRPKLDQAIIDKIKSILIKIIRPTPQKEFKLN